MRHTFLAGVLAAATLASQGLAAQAACTATSSRPVLDPARRPVQGTTLTMAAARYRVGTTEYATNVYNGQFMGPTLTMLPGQTFALNVVNNMSATPVQPATQVSRTNFHTHGLVVTPKPTYGDNVTNVSIPNGGGRNAYNFPVPAYHTQGMFWYHPHPHELTSSQVAGGLSGALMVGSILTYFPEYDGVRERTLLIRDMLFTFGSPLLFNINGSTCARLPVAPGEKQLWHIGNFSANSFVNLKLTGAQWTLLAMDGNPLAAEEQIDSLYIPPGSRAEVIVTGPTNGQPVQLITDTYPGGPKTPTTLGYVVPAATRARALRTPRPRRAGLDAAVVDTLRFLRNATNVNRDTFRYSFPSQTTAAVNGVVYSPGDAPVMIPWGQVQEWTIINESTALHTFHIHQTDFDIIELNGVAVTDSMLRDNVPVGIHQVNGQTVGDTVVVRFTFEPIAEGPFVFHCHVLQHEDEGMMMNVCVYDPADPTRGKQTCQNYFSGQTHAGH